MDCIFCKIVRGEIAAYIVYEDLHTLAFLDIHPNNPGHTLVIPRIHSENIYTIEASDLDAIICTTQKIAKAVKKAVHADGINLAMNNESVAGQVVFHSHFHVIPRFADDGYKHWPQHSYKEGEAEVLTEKIKTAID